MRRWGCNYLFIWLNFKPIRFSRNLLFKRIISRMYASRSAYGLFFVPEIQSFPKFWNVWAQAPARYPLVGFIEDIRMTEWKSPERKVNAPWVPSNISAPAVKLAPDREFPPIQAWNNMLWKRSHHFPSHLICRKRRAPKIRWKTGWNLISYEYHASFESYTNFTDTQYDSTGQCQTWTKNWGTQGTIAIEAS